jgi:iron-sulfur cluster insertion protein
MQSTDQTSATPPLPSTFFLTESAAERINFLKKKENKQNLRFRITVKGGGCSGFQYDFSLDDSTPSDADLIFSLHGADVIIDDVSIGIIGGSTLNYTEDLSSAGFEIKNPQATARCGCGNSFSVAL